MMSESDVKVRVRQVVNEVKNVLSTSKDPHKLCQELHRLIRLLPPKAHFNSPCIDSFKLTNLTGSNKPTTSLSTDLTRVNDDPSRLIVTKLPDTSGLTTDYAELTEQLSTTKLKTLKMDFPESDIPTARVEFCTCHYIRLLESLVSLFSLDWYGRFEPQQKRGYIDVFFMHGVPQDVFMVLSSAVIHNSPSFKQNKCISLLEDFLSHHCLTSMLWMQCTVSTEENTAPAQDAKRKIQWDELINMIVSLPDRMANKMREKCRELFYPNQYFKLLGKEILNVLHNVYTEISVSKDCSLQFVSQLIGRVCICGHADSLFGVLLPHFAKLTQNDFIWIRICIRLVAGAPERSLESILHCIIQQIPWYGIMSRLLGDAVLSNKQLEYLLTNKFLLHRHYKQDIVPQNIIGYLTDSPNRRLLLIKTLKTVLDVWGDSSAIKHTSYDQQMYLTKVILICIGHLNSKEKQDNKSDLMYKLMPGVQNHISSPITKVRRLGMVVAEAMTMTLEPDGPKLSFEYEKDEQTETMRALLVPAEDTGREILTKDVEDVSVDVNAPVATTQTATDSNYDKTSAQQDTELDSDDDLEPYDMTYDPKVTQVKTPMYIRDCMEGLQSKDNPDLFEMSLKVCEKLIKAKPDDLPDVCEEFVKILLHLENSYDTENFVSLKHGSMASLAVQCPVLVAQYLTSEFYDRNYSIKHRLDILEVLAAAAQELSQPIEVSSCSGPSRKNKEVSSSSSDLSSSETWRNIVQKRIESKTRRFAKGSSKPLPVAVANRFAPVAGYFFFPLMKQYDRKLNTMDILGEDFLLLGRMLYTLGIVIHAAQNTNICRQMASNLLEFIWVLRYHTEPFVRQALLFTVSMVILSVPPHLLVSDLQDDLLECKLWIEGIVEKDPDTECKILAAQTLVLMQSSVKKELDQFSDNAT